MDVIIQERNEAELFNNKLRDHIVELQNEIQDQKQFINGLSSKISDMFEKNILQEDYDKMKDDLNVALGNKDQAERRWLDCANDNRILREKIRHMQNYFLKLINMLPKDEQSCSICLDEYKDGGTIELLPCNHFYHSECIGDWFKTDKSCPICRTKTI